MRYLRLAGISAALAIALATTGLAHSLEELEGELGDREKYFQPIDQEAPGFALEDASGHAVELEDLRGKVVVLHFVYTSCPDVCPLHAERIAEIQEMVNRTPMRDLVQFVTITTDPERCGETARARPAEPLGEDSWLVLTAHRRRRARP
jgi:protein SCO1